MHVLHVDTGREDRGGQRQVALLVGALPPAECRNTVAVARGSPLARRLRGTPEAGVLELPLSGELSLLALPALAHLLRGGGISLIHAHTAHAVTAAQLARQAAGAGRSIPLLAHRRVDIPLARGWLARRKRSWPDAWIAVSATVREQLARDGIAPARVFVVPSAIDPARAHSARPRAEVRASLGLKSDQPTLLMVGELVEHKGHAVALDALGALARQQLRPMLLVAGGGPLMLALRAQSLRNGVGEQIQWLGPREDIADLIVASDLLLFPSLWGEGSPAVPKEALLLGLPLLCSDLPACRELPLAAGQLLPVGDVAAWTEALARWSRAEPTPGATEEAQRAAARAFSPTTMAASTLTVYRELLRRLGH